MRNNAFQSETRTFVIRSLRQGYCKLLRPRLVADRNKSSKSFGGWVLWLSTFWTIYRSSIEHNYSVGLYNLPCMLAIYSQDSKILSLQALYSFFSYILRSLVISVDRLSGLLKTTLVQSHGDHMFNDEVYEITISVYGVLQVDEQFTIIQYSFPLESAKACFLSTIE